MDDETGRLVDDEQMLVLPHHTRRDRWRDGRRRRFGLRQL
jgi:hypothetical protein